MKKCDAPNFPLITGLNNETRQMFTDLAQKEKTMDVKKYCDGIGAELNSWKAKLYDLIRKTESLSDGEKLKVAPLVRDLNSMMDDLNSRLKSLEKECPSEWSLEEAAIDDTLSRMRGTWKDVWGAMGEPEYGIGGA